MSDHSLSQRLSEYFETGGLFNPELADHEVVSNLLRECQARIHFLERDAELKSRGHEVVVQEYRDEIRHMEKRRHWDLEAAKTGVVIEVEKLLCEKLGRKWTPSGISIELLVNQLAGRKP